MNATDQDANRIIRSWLDEGPTSLSGRVRGRVLGALPATRQDRASLWRRRVAIPGGAFRAAIAVTAMVMLVAVGANVLTRTDGIGSPSASPTPSPEAAPLAAGEHLIPDVAPIGMTITLPEGWHGGTFDSKWWAGSSGRGIVWLAKNVHSPCMDEPTLDRTDVAIDGFAAERIEFTSASPCRPNRLFDDLGAPPGRGPDWLVTLWVVEFNGIDLVMIAATGPSDPTEMVALRRLVESVQIEAPNPVPFPVEIWRPLAVGEQAITEVAPLRLTITLPAGWEGGSWGSRGWSAAQDGFGGLGFAVNVSVPCLEPPSLDGLHTTIDGFAAEHTAVRIGSRQCHPNGVLDKLGYGPGRMQWVDVWVVDVDGIRLWMVATTGSGNATQDAAAMADLGRLVESVDIEAP